MAEAYRRVIAKLLTDTPDRSELVSRRTAFISKVRAAFLVDAEPLFPGAELDPAAPDCLLRYVVSNVPPETSAESFAAVLVVRYKSDVDAPISAYAEPEPVRPPAPVTVDPWNDPKRAQQRYLNKGPVGVGAEAVWPLATGQGIPGADGTGVRIVDIEQGWSLTHEDLLGGHIQPLLGELNHDFRGHGTSVLGIIAAQDNAKGGLGIAPKSEITLVCQFTRDSAGRLVYNTASAIWRVHLRNTLRAGDVLLIEAQLRDGERLLPVEAEPAVKCVLQYFTTVKGIIVIEAAGNGGLRLDDVVLGSEKPFAPTAPSSGAILAGAATATARRRLRASNFGSRIDCFAWGEDILACGDGQHGTAPALYTPSFGGTSGAAAIIAGVAALVQCIARTSTTGTAATVSDTRHLLSTYGTLSASTADAIGVMPDLEKIAAALCS